MKRKHPERRIYARFFKRPFDVFLAFCCILFFSPLLAALALLVRQKLGSPVFFKQKRPGLHERVFVLYKFRTMNEERDEDSNLLPDAQRLTRFGRFLRSSSLDELPELVNILRGDMSFVGPRPLSVLYLPYYTPEERKRHSVRPGLTGLAQINGRNALTWEEKFKFDIEYIETISFWGDLRIILSTAQKVIQRSNIGQAEEAPESLHVIRKNYLKT